jgi:nucleotide-binding universal stress UspA family protein
MGGFQRILVATDGSAVCEGAVDRAIELSGSLGAQLLVLTVATGADVSAADLESARDPLGAAEEATMAVSRRASRPAVEEAVAQATAAAQRCVTAGVAARAVVWEGPAADSVLAAADAERADLIVVGSHCRGGVGRMLLGSVSDHVVRHSRVPVMVVPPIAVGTAGADGAAARTG